MSRSVEELQQELQDKIKKLDEEAKLAADAHAKERAERLAAEEAERAKRLAEIRANEETHAKRKLIEQEQEALRKKAATEERVSLEIKQNALDEVLRKQQEKLEWLEQEAAKAEFMEEQLRKAVEDAELAAKAVATGDTSGDTFKINIEHPEAPVNPQLPGEAVEGTGGLTPETPLMSSHLKHILRQATRNY